MATLSFAGTTIWNDSSTGVGRVRVPQAFAQAVFQRELVPRGRGVILKRVATVLGTFDVICRFHLPSGDVDNLRNLVEGKVGDQGTLVTPEDGSITNCVLLQAQMFPGNPQVVRNESGAVGHVRDLFLTFEKVR